MRVRVGLAAAVATAAMWAMFVLGAGPAAATPLGSFAPPVASFTYSTPDTSGAAITFDASSSSDPNGGTITDYTWDFGDGTTVDSGSSPTAPHTYASPGSYPVTVTVTDSEGDPPATSAPQTVVVSAPPTASFTVGSPDVATTPISFDASASNDPNAGGSITNYHWDFGDGTAAVDTPSATTSHTYAGPGTHTVTLTVTDAEGGTATTSQTVTVAAAPPTAAFAVGSPDTASSPISFDASGSSDPNAGGSIIDYQWDFGDSTGTVDSGSSATTSHTYASPGSYTVTLTVTDSESGTASASHTFTVYAPPTVSVSWPTGGADNQTVPFTATASDPNGGSITNYAWDFGDGQTVSGANAASVSHAYAKPGTYTVTLTATDSESGTVTSMRTITIDDAPATAAIVFSPSSPMTADTAVSFTGSSSGGDPNDSPPTYYWVFGDGATATSASFTHVYQTPGTYTVTLTLTDDDGRTTTSRRITVTPATGAYSTPTAAFTAPSGRTGVPVSFDGSQSHDPNAGGSLSYRWDFGDGGVGAGVRPSHTFAAGTWTVTLTVTDNVSNRSNQVSHVVTITTQRPTAAFAAPVGAAGRAVSFAAQASNGHYRWSFGDGSHGSGRSPRHTYKRRGTYTVTLTVSDASGHKASVSHRVTIGTANACVVPALVGETLSAAGRALQAGHCTLGHVTAPHAPKHSPGHGRVWTRVVTAQKPTGPRLKPSRFAVAVTVAYVARSA